jgi:hypothetical protein
MQPQPDLGHPVPDRPAGVLRLASADAVHHAVVGVAFERYRREDPAHPRVERVMQKQVRQHGRDRRALWGTAVSLLQGAVRMLHGGGKPPPDIQHHPRQVGVGLHRFDHEVVVDAVEERLNVQIDCPVVLPATSPACRHRVQRRPSRPVAVGVWMEDRLDLALQPPRYHRLGDPVPDGRHAKNPDPSACGFGIRTALTGGGR